MVVGAPEKPDEYNEIPNESQDDFDRIKKANFPTEEQRAMEERAIDGAAKHIIDNSDSTAEDLLKSEQGIDSADKKGGLEDQENTPDSGWKNNTSSQKGSVTGRFKGMAKKRTAIAAVTACFAVFGLIFSFMTGAMGIVQIKENLTAKFGQWSENPLDSRRHKVLAKRLSGDLTSGCVVKIKCRYRGFTDREIKKFNKRAERMGSSYRLDPGSRSALNPLKRKVVIRNIDTGKVIQSGNVRGEIVNNKELRDTVRAFYKTNVEYHAGRVGSWTMAKFKVFRGKVVSKLSDKTKALREIVRRIVTGEAASLNAEAVPEDGSGTPDPSSPETPDVGESSTQLNEEVAEAIEPETDRQNADVNNYDKNGAQPTPGSAEEKARFGSIISKIKNKGKGFASGVAGNPASAAQNVCLLRMIGSAAINAKRYLLALRLIPFAVQYAVLADQIKANEADSKTLETTESFMGFLMAKDQRGYTGFDSLGYNWLTSTSGATQGTPNEDVGRFQSGGFVPGVFGSVITSLIQMNSLKSVCKVAFSKIVTAVSIGLNFTGGLGAILKGASATALKEAVQAAVRGQVKNSIEKIIEKEAAKTALKKTLIAYGAISTAEEIIPLLFDIGLPSPISMLAAVTSGMVLSGDEKGPDTGNALVSGFGAYTARNSKAQGLMPLTPKRAAANESFAYQEQLKIAKEDGINQFDTSNRFSFAYKMSTTTLPLQAKFSSFTSIPTALANIASTGLSLPFTQNTQAASPESQYTFCANQDEIYKDLGVATDPMCNPIFGFVGSFAKSIDPDDVVDYLLSMGLIDEEGEPQNEFRSFINECMQSTKPLGEEDNGNCMKGGGMSDTVFAGENINKKSPFSDTTYAASGDFKSMPEEDQKYAMMRLYCMDTSIDVDMDDGEGVSCIPKVESNSGSSSGEEVAPEEVDESTLFEPSDNIACAPGTSDLGIQDGYSDGNVVKIRICGVTGFESTGEESNDGFGVTGAGGACVVNSRVSAAVLAMFKSAKNDGLVLKARSCFRTMAHQQSLCPCDGVSVARPGYSNHQIGAAIDFQELESTPGPVPGNRVWEWLSANASKYSYKNYPAEAWHWSPTGH